MPIITLTRGKEWLSVFALENPDQVLWLYGVEKVGTDRRISPRSVLTSQLDAHRSKGWG